MTESMNIKELVEKVLADETLTRRDIKGKELHLYNLLGDYARKCRIVRKQLKQSFRLEMDGKSI